MILPFRGGRSPGPGWSVLVGLDVAPVKLAGALPLGKIDVKVPAVPPDDFAAERFARMGRNEILNLT